MILGAVTDEAAADLSGAPAGRARLWRLEAENQQRTVGSASSHLPRLKLSDLRWPRYKHQPSDAAPTSQRFLNQMCVLFRSVLDCRPLGAAQYNYGHYCWQKRGIFAAAGWSFSWLRKKKKSSIYINYSVNSLPGRCFILFNQIKNTGRSFFWSWKFVWRWDRRKGDFNVLSCLNLLQVAN